MRSFSLGVASALLAMTASAQLGQFVNGANFPNGPTHKLDVQALISAATSPIVVDGILGCEIDNFGSIWVTARMETGQPNHMLYELKWNSTTSQWDVNQYQQPAGVSTSTWGMRDIAYDGRIHIYSGCEFANSNNTIYAFNVVTKKWDSNFDIVLQSVPTGVSTARALAYDPNGAGGQGTFWLCNWSSVHVEVDRTGTILRQVPNVQQSSYGAAYNPDTKSIWWFGQAYNLGATGATYPQAIASEMLVKDGSATGNRVIADRGIPPSSTTYHAGGLAGGMAIFKDAAGTPVMMFLHQALSDTISLMHAGFSPGAGSDGLLSMNDHPASNVVLPNQTVSSFGLRVTGSTAAAVVPMLGIAPIAIPLPLAGLAPNSTLYTNPILYGNAGTVTNGTAEVPFPVPNDTNLNQLVLYMQMLGVHTGGPFGLSMTNGGYFALNIN
jgi:hypothetical protein